MANVEKVLLFGSTGRIGTGLLERLVTEFQVSVYVRTPSKVPESMKDKVNIIQGDVLNDEQVNKAMEGQDAVIFAIGQHRVLGASTIASDGTKTVLEGMKKNGVQKLIVINIPIGYQRGTFNHTLLKGFTSIGDHGKQMDVLKAEKEVSWMAIATPWVKYVDTVNPTYMVELNKDPGVNSVTSGELADFMVKILKSEDEFKKYNHGLAGISSKPKTGWFN